MVAELWVVFATHFADVVEGALAFVVFVPTVIDAIHAVGAIVVIVARRDLSISLDERCILTKEGDRPPFALVCDRRTLW